jgi:hypothetical protein
MATKLIERFRPGVERHWAAQIGCHLTEVVDAMAVIGVGVSDDDLIDRTDAGGQQLPPEVRAAIDQQQLAFTLDQNR